MSKEILTELLNERVKLAERIEGISFYLKKGTLTEKEMDLALDQKHYMEYYLFALKERIKYYEE